MKPISLWSSCAALVVFANTVYAGGTWEKITVPLNQYIVTIANQDKEIKPSCAFGQPYSFYFKPGKSKKLIVFLNGGGACWDYNTCASPLKAEILSTFVPDADISANDPNLRGGILDVKNPDNPYKNWTMAFLSYCTGDAFMGSKQVDYQNPDNADDNLTIQHRGFDNFLYVMNYLRQQWNDNEDATPRKVLVAGSSAGGYGAVINFPWVKEILNRYDEDDGDDGDEDDDDDENKKKRKMFLIGDGGSGVIGDDFVVEALFGAESSWNIDENLHPVLSSLPEGVTASNFLRRAYSLVGTHYRKDKFAQYTTAFDAVQILFLDIMQNVDNPVIWGGGLQDPNHIFGWNFNMNSINEGISNALPKNYRLFIDRGCNHTILRDDEFYSASIDGISFLEWTEAMTKRKKIKKGKWQSVSCSAGDCGEVDLTPTGIGACLARSLSTS